MGAVWVAEQQEPVKRRVALKLIKAGMDSRHVLRRFEQERQALALMDHPHIAKVLDAGSTYGRPYFVMELVKGVPITRYCDELHLTLRERLELFLPVCQAIQHAHQKGIVHRDIKPTNVMVCIQDGKPAPKVIDFGVAKALHQQLTEQSLYTEIGQVIGTLEYMSPEQAELSALDIDTRADVYALGVLLYELLTGSTPLRRKRLKDAAVLELLRRIREEEPPKPSTRLSESKESLASMAALRRTEPGRLAKAVRGELDWIVMKALEKDRTRRYETAIGLARDIERHLHDEPVEACPPSAGYRLRKFARRYRTVLATATAFAAMLLIAAGVSIWLALAARRAESIANDKREEAEEAQQKEAHERNRADREASQAKANAVETGRALDRITVAKGIELAEKSDLFRALSWFVKPLERGGLTPEEERVQTVCDRAVWQWDARSGRQLGPPLVDWGGVLQQPLSELPQTPLQFVGNIGAQNVADARWNGSESVEISRDGRRALFSYKRVLSLWDLVTRKLIGQWLRGEELFSPDHALSPDGQLLLLIRDGEASVHETKSGKVVSRPIKHGGHVESVAFSPDGTRALTFGERGIARVWNARTWQPLARISDSNYRSVAQFSPDNRFVACWGWSMWGLRNLAWFDAESGQLVREVADIENDLEGFDWRPDGQQLLRVSKWDEVRLWNSSPEWSMGPLLRHGSAPTAAVYAPDGRKLLTTTQDGLVRIWDLCDRTEHVTFNERESDFNRDIRRFIIRRRYSHRRSTEELTEIKAPIITITSRRTVGWPQRAGIARLLPPGTEFNRGAISPDQNRVITSHPVAGAALRVGESIQLWNARTGTRVGQPVEYRSLLAYVTFSPDSRFVVLATEAGKVQVLNARTSEPVGKPLEHDRVVYAAFSPDGELLVTCGEDQAARLWQTKTGQPSGERLWHGDTVLCAAFSPDGKTLATASGDGTIRLWDVVHRSMFGVLERRAGSFWDIAFHPKRSLLMVSNYRLSSQNTQMRIWDVGSRQEVGPIMEDFYNMGAPPFCLLSFRDDDRVTFGFGVAGMIDLSGDNRPADALVKLTQLYSGQRLSTNGGTASLNKQDLQALWRELSAKYPEEFAVSLKTAVKSRIVQLQSATRKKKPFEIAFHRRWLAAELAESGWQAGERGNEDMERGNYLQRLLALALHGRQAEAIAASDDLAARWPKDADTLYGCACVHALAAGAVKGDAALAERYAARAVALLRQAIEAGYKDGQHMRKDTDLDALRSHKDFGELLKKLDANKP